jgi:hypothetical protein
LRNARALACIAAALLLAVPAFSQGIPNGKVSGHVTSEGAALPGVTVTVTSPALQGERSTVTSGSGDFLFPSLPPGDYAVTFQLEGMQDINQNIRVAAAQTAVMDVEMSGDFAEEIVVTGTASLEAISETSQGAVTYGKQLVDELPAGRTLSQIVALSPGVQPNGPSKDSVTGLSNITVSGAPTNENLFLLNGVVLNENLRGQAFDLLIEDAIQETTTATSGVSAEYGRFSGGVVNVITKSGGNDFSGSFRTTLRNQDWEEETPLTTVQTDEIVPTYEATLGGPVLRDRLWFFLAGRDREAETPLNTAAPTSIPYTNLRDQQRYEGKLTGTITPRHTLIGSYMEIEDLEAGNSFGTILDEASLVTRETPQELWAVNYAGTFGSSFLLTAQYSERQFTFIGSGAQSRDLITGTLLIDRSRGAAPGSRYHSPTFCGVCRDEERDNTNLLLKGSYFFSSDRLGAHEFIAGYDNFEDIRVSDNHQSGSGYRILGTSAAISGTNITPIFTGDGSTIIQFDPILRASEGAVFVTDSYFANDNWRVNDHLSLNLGLRYDVNDGQNGAGQKVADDSKISPRLGAAFDTFADGRLTFFANYGEYVAALANSIGDSSSSGGVASTIQWLYRGPNISGVSQDEALRQLFAWFTAANGGLPSITAPVGGGIVPVSAAAIGGVNRQIRESLQSPSVVEYSLGASAQIGSRGMVRADLVYREWEDFYAQRTDRQTGQVVGQLGSVRQTFDLTLVENDNDLYERTYRGLHTQFRYRASDKIDLGGNWTLSYAEGNFEGENQASGPVAGLVGNYPEYLDIDWNSPEGDLSIDQRHRVNLYGVFRVFDNDRHGMNIGILQSYFSGHPYSAVGTIRTGAFVTNPGYASPPPRVNYFFSDRGEFTTPDVTRTNLSIDYQVRFSGLELFVKPEVINVFNEDEVDTTDSRYFNTTILTADNAATCSPGVPCQTFNPFTTTPVEGVHFVKGPNFGKPINPLGYQQPRTYLISAGLRF